MFDEARRRRERGQDIVVGAIQPKVPPEVEALLRKLEVIPMKQVAGGAGDRCRSHPVRRPAVCFIDGLAYDNPPGSRIATRWQDVQDLLNAGIKVVASINVQYVDELREQVESITGKPSAKRFPVSFIKSADEIEIVDAPPEEPIERTPEEEVERPGAQQRLSKLRELALVLAADVVDHQLERLSGAARHPSAFGAHERILVCITPRANVEEMIETAKSSRRSFMASSSSRT